MQGGGAERVAALLSNYWAGQGHELILMPTFSGRGECFYSLDDRVKLDFLADRVAGKKRSLRNRLLRLLALRQVMKEVNPDVILSFLTDVNVAAILAAYGLKYRLIVSERNYPPAKNVSLVLRNLRRLCYPRAAAVVVQTRQTLGWLQLCCPKAIGKVIANPLVLPLSATGSVLNPSKIADEEAKILLAVGRLHEQKGFDQLISVFAKPEIQQYNWTLVILGEGSERRFLENLVRKLRLEHSIFLPGRVGNLEEWYRRADLFVLSSRYEGFPNTLLEAMGHGVPVISFDCNTGPSEMIKHGFNGYLVEPNDLDSLAQRLEELMVDESFRRRLGWNATVVRERFSMEGVGHRWSEVLGLNK